MLKTRVIPTLLYRDFGLVKGVGFDGRRTIGSAMQAIKVYEMRGVDELIFLDVAATANNRGPDLALIDDLADECFMPLTVGGGVHQFEHVQQLLEKGADRVCIGTAAIESPRLVEKAAAAFGSQCVVVSVDVFHGAGSPTLMTRCGTVPVGLPFENLVVSMQEAGAGELLIQSVDRDGTMSGYDLEVLERVAAVSNLPLIASGGAGSYEDLIDALRVAGVGAVAAASMFQFTEQTPMGAKQALSAAGFPVRK